MNQLCHILNANSTWYQTMIAEFITFWYKSIVRRRARRVIRRERNASQSSFPKVKVPLKRPFKRRLCYEKLNHNTSNWALMLMAGRCKSPISKDSRLFRRRFRVPYPIFPTNCKPHPREDVVQGDGWNRQTICAFWTEASRCSPGPRSWNVLRWHSRAWIT